MKLEKENKDKKLNKVEKWLHYLVKRLVKKTRSCFKEMLLNLDSCS